MNSEKTVNLAPVRGSSPFNQLKDVDLVGGVPRELFESPPPLAYMVSPSGGGHLYEVLRAVGSDCHDIRPEEVDLLPLGSNRSSSDISLLAKPVLRCDLRHTRIQTATLRSVNDVLERKVASDSASLQ